MKISEEDTLKPVLCGPSAEFLEPTTPPVFKLRPTTPPVLKPRPTHTPNFQTRTLRFQTRLTI